MFHLTLAPGPSVPLRGVRPRPGCLKLTTAYSQGNEVYRVALKENPYAYGKPFPIEKFVLIYRFRAVYSSDKMPTELEHLRERTRELEENQRRLALIYDTIRVVIFHLAVEPNGRFRFVSVNAAFLKATGLSRDAVV